MDGPSITSFARMRARTSIQASIKLPFENIFVLDMGSGHFLRFESGNRETLVFEVKDKNLVVAPPNLKAHSQYILMLGYHGIGRGVGPIIGN